MKKITRYITIALAMIGAAIFVSCHGQPDEPAEPIIDPTDPTQNVPEGVLRIFADKTSITADGSDVVTFTVMFGSEDVSNARTLQLTRTIDGNEKLMNYGVNTFSTTIPGTYTFKAEFYRAGQYYSDNEVEVVAVSGVADGETREWIQKILGFQFTSVGCSSCPDLAASLKSVQANFPDRVIPVAFHRDFGKSDPMTIPMSDSYYKCINRQGLPQFNANLIISDEYTTVSEYTAIVDILDRVEMNYPATCGVAIESSMVVGGDRAVKVKVKVTSNTPSQYRYQIFLVEDGVESSILQDGAGSDYIHNNVVRATWSDKTYGELLNEGANLQVGVETTVERTMQIPIGCNLDNMRIVAAAMVSYDGGNSYVVNNCAECPLGGSVDYNTIDAPALSSRFERHICVMDLTGTWCSFCPEGMTKLKFYIQKEEWKDIVHLLALHDNTQGEDPMGLALTSDVMKKYGNYGYPMFVTDLRDSGSLTEHIANIAPSFERSLEEYPACSDVKIATTISGEELSVDVALFPEVAGEWKASVFLVEDGIVAAQKDGSLTHDDYPHDHVARAVVSKYWMGDSLGTLAAEQEATKSYTITLDEEWNRENMYVMALSVDSNGYVNNVAVCPLGESVDYKYLAE